MTDNYTNRLIEMLYKSQRINNVEFWKIGVIRKQIPLKNLNRNSGLFKSILSLLISNVRIIEWKCFVSKLPGEVKKIIPISPPTSRIVNPEKLGRFLSKKLSNSIIKRLVFFTIPRFSFPVIFPESLSGEFCVIHLNFEIKLCWLIIIAKIELYLNFAVGRNFNQICFYGNCK